MRATGLIAASMLALLPGLAVAQAQPRPPATTQQRPTTPAPARPAGGPQLQVPQPAGLLILVRGTVSALNQANLTGNYSVLHALGSDTMRTNTNPQSLAQGFINFRQRGVDLSPALVLNPQFTQQVAISGGRLHLVGRFPSQPMAVTFDLWFEMSQNRWKPVQINVGLAQAQAQQGQPPQGQAQQPRQPQGQQPRPVQRQR